jgi:hypothetical protein
MNPLGLLVHGPEVIDEGEAEEAIARLKGAGFGVEAALGGITGKTAVIDAGMRRVIDISKDMKPSEVVEDFLKRGIDFIVLVNHAKTEESGFMLGEGVLRNVIDRSGASLSFVQLEYRGGIIIQWHVKPGDEGIYEKITAVFSDLEAKKPSKLESRCTKDAHSNLVYREIRGVHPGEKIVVDGVVIGMSSHENKNNRVTLVAKEGKLVNIEGGTLIQHNLDKLPSLNLENEMIKTASVIRRTKPRRIEMEDMQKNGKRKKIALFLYTLERLFPKLEQKDADIAVAVTIGDDTTSIAGDILKRFGIRMIGITDGDADGLIAGIEQGALAEYAKFLPPDSLILRLKPERDDIIGKRVREELFNGSEELELEGDIETQLVDLKRRILDLAEADVLAVLRSPAADCKE